MVEHQGLVATFKRMRSTALLIFAMAIVAISGPTNAVASAVPMPIIELRDGEFFTEPSRGQASYFLDYSGELQASDLLAQLDGFSIVTTENLGFEAVQPGNPIVWFHFRVRNSSQSANEWVINTGRPLGTIDLSGFLARKDGNLSIIFECNAQACPANGEEPFISGTISLSPGEEADFFVRQPPRFSSQTPITFATHEAFGEWQADRNVRIWVMNGAWLAIIGMALLMGKVIGRRLAIAFTGYSLASFGLVGLSQGSLRLIPEGLFAPFLEDFGLQLGLIFLILFSKEFFQTKHFFPKSDVAIKVIILVSLINLVPILLGVGTSARVFAQTLIIFVLCAQVSVALRAAKNGWHGAVPVVLGALAILVAGLFDQLNKIFGGAISRELTLEVIHAAFFAESALFAVAIILKVLSLQRDRDRVLREQLESTREALQLSRDLESNRLRYHRAKQDAEDSKREIAAIGHDLRQPLNALRNAIGSRSHRSEEEEARLNTALSLIEGIARRDTTEQAESMAEGRLASNIKTEVFPIQIVLENTFRMFAEEASSLSISLKPVSCSLNAVCDPVALMRISSNLVANAIAHSGASKIRIGCRRKGKHISFEVHDNGNGMTDDALSKSMKEGIRGERSEGSGLGLAIVQNLCEDHALSLDVSSGVGLGTSFSVQVPQAQE